MKRKKIRLSALIYAMMKKWKVMLAAFLVILIAGSALVLKSGPAKPQTPAAPPTPVTDETAAARINNYRTYLANSAYMELDPSNIHVRYLTYSVNWEGVDQARIESKNAALFQWIALYYPSDEFAAEITAIKEEYKDKALYELVGVGRSGNVITFNVTYSDDKYLNDLCAVIDSTLKKKHSQWAAAAGEFELTPGPVTDRTVDGYVSGHKSNQDAKIAVLNQYDAQVAAAAAKAEADAKANAVKEVKERPMSVRLITVFILAVLGSLVCGGLAAIYSSKLFYYSDIEDTADMECLCVMPKNPEPGLDKLFYKNVDCYHNKELYLSMWKKKLADEGVGRIFLYDVSGGKENDKCEIIRSGFSNDMDVESVSRENIKNICNDGGKSAVLIVAGSGSTCIRDILSARDCFEILGVYCPGVILIA